MELTDVGHLGHASVVGPMQELRRVVVDVLHLDDEFRRRLQGFVGVSVHGLGGERVLGLFFTIQRLGRVDVACFIIDDEDGSGTFT